MNYILGFVRNPEDRRPHTLVAPPRKVVALASSFYKIIGMRMQAAPSCTVLVTTAGARAGRSAKENPTRRATNRNSSPTRRTRLSMAVVPERRVCRQHVVLNRRRAKRPYG